MKIPKNLPQFEKQPALFVASGEYEAKFYLALNGILDLKAEIKMPPRQEAREKQAFIGIKGEKRGLASVSHQGAYLEDLKKKFSQKIYSAIRSLLIKYQLREIYFFAPSYVANRVMKKINPLERKKIRMIINKELTKTNPLAMIKIFWQETQSAITLKTKPEKEKIFPRLRKK